MVLPLALLLAYCSGPNNTQRTNTDTNTDATASTTTTTVSDDMATTSTDVSDVNTNTATVTTDNTNHADRSLGNVTVDHSSSVINPIPNDPNDPMYQHWQRTNAQNWTWDMNYPGYDRPTGGTYNSAINGDWQLVMTPELVTAWRTDDSRSLWLRNGNTYLSASESFNTRSGMNGVSAGTTLNGSTNVNGTNSAAGTNINGAATLNGQYSSTFDPQSETYMGNNRIGSVNVNGSTSAGTISSNNSSSSTSGLNNNASANANTANRMNGSSSNTTTTSPVTSSANAGATVNANSNSTSATNGLGSSQVSGSAAGTLSTQGGSGSGSAGVNGSAGISGSSTMGTTGTMGTMDVNSINYNAYNGNMYQMPKFNLYLDNGSFTGYTGCNGISGRVEVTGNSLHFLNTTPSTAIDCLGGFNESMLLDILRRVDSYAYVGDELQLMQGNQVLLRFKRNSQDTTLK